MQIANALLALAGERDNTVPKYDVTPAEVLLLRALHGEDAVTDIVILDATKNVKSAEERERLYGAYARNTPEGRRCPELDALFPGVAARLPETFDDIGLDEVFYARKPSEAAPVDPLDHDGDGRKGGSRKGARGKKAEGQETPEPEAADGAGDADDKNLFK